VAGVTSLGACGLPLLLAFSARPAGWATAAVPVPEGCPGGSALPPAVLLALRLRGVGRLGRPAAGGAGAWASGFWGVGVEDAGQEVGWDGAVAVGVAAQGSWGDTKLFGELGSVRV
jgi:hypothetical protein